MLSNVKAARFLGIASLLVGGTELAATKWLEEQMGVSGHKTLIRAFGLREIAAGAVLLKEIGLNKKLVGGLWGRVAGDAADLAMLGLAARKSRNPLGLGVITGIVIAITGLDILVAARANAELVKVREKSEAARHRPTPAKIIPTNTSDDLLPAYV